MWKWPRRCPKCLQEIDTLVAYETGTKVYEVKLDSERVGLNFEDIDYWPDGVESYACPYCEEVITEDYEDALRFLRDEKKER